MGWPSRGTYLVRVAYCQRLISQKARSTSILSLVGDRIVAEVVGAEAPNPVHVVNLCPLMARTAGRPEVKVGLIDGPVAGNHPDLAGAKIRQIPRISRGGEVQADGSASTHGTFVAGMLFARRGSVAPAICPDCT